MWKAFDGSLVTTVCRSSLARKILCNNKCEGRWWEAGGGVHFSPFLLFFPFFFFPFLLVLLAAETGIYKMTQKSHRPGLEWGSEKTMKNALCAFSDIWPPVVLLDAQRQEQRGASHSSVISGIPGRRDTPSCLHPSWLWWGVRWEQERMKMSLSSGSCSYLQYIQLSGTHFPDLENEDTWISEHFGMVGLQGKTHPCLRGGWVPGQSPQEFNGKALSNQSFRDITLWSSYRWMNLGYSPKYQNKCTFGAFTALTQTQHSSTPL